MELNPSAVEARTQTRDFEYRASPAEKQGRRTSDLPQVQAPRSDLDSMDVRESSVIAVPPANPHSLSRARSLLDGTTFPPKKPRRSPRTVYGLTWMQSRMH